MKKLEVFQNGVFSATGLPVYQIGTKNEDGTYDITVYDLMDESQAKAKLQELQPETKVEAKPKAKPKAKPAVKLPSKPDLSSMTKLEIEEEMRFHGLELDRRKSKNDLVKEAVAYLKGK